MIAIRSTGVNQRDTTGNIIIVVAIVSLSLVTEVLAGSRSLARYYQGDTSRTANAQIPAIHLGVLLASTNRGVNIARVTLSIVLHPVLQVHFHQLSHRGAGADSNG